MCFVLFVVKTVYSFSCPFVCIRGSKMFFVFFVLFVVKTVYSFRVFRVFRGYDYLFSFVSIRVHSWFISHLGRRAAESPCGRAQARQPCTTFSSLLPTLYFGSHCKVTTHYLLLSPPYSLLNHNYGFVVGFRVDIEGRDLSVLPGCIHREASPCPEAVELSILPGLWECRQQMYDTCV